MEANVHNASLKIEEKEKKIHLILGFNIHKKLSNFRRFIGFNMEKATTISLSKLLLLYQIKS